MALGLTLTGCFGSGNAASPTTTTLPAAPPSVVGYVTLIGSGQQLGAGNAVRAIDLSAGVKGAIRSIPVGAFPDALAVSPDDKTLYVTNYSSDSVTPIDIATGRPAKPIAVGAGPAGIAIAPDGKTAYVTDAGSNPIGHTVTPINLKTKKALTPTSVGDGPQGIVITPDGSTAYVANAGGIVTGQNAPLGHTVTPIDLSKNTPGAPISVGNAPLALSVTADGATLYVANSGSGSVTPVTVSGNVPGDPISVDGSPQALVTAGSSLYVADSSSAGTAGNNLTPITISGGTAGAPILLGKAPTSVAVSPDGSTAYVVCSGADQIDVVDLAKKALDKAATLNVPGGVYAIALTEVPAAKLAGALGIKAHKATTSA